MPTINASGTYVIPTAAGVVDVPYRFSAGGGPYDGTAGVIIQGINNTPGQTTQIVLANVDATNTASHAGLHIETVPTGGDPYVLFDVSSAGKWIAGLDNSDSDNFKISASTSLGTTDTFIATTAGEITMPLQPAFYAWLDNTTASSVTGDGTTYTLGSTANLTEVYDQNSDFNVNGTFTAPVTGRYHFNTIIALNNIGASHAGYYIGFITSNRSIYVLQTNAYNNSSGTQYHQSGASYSDMDAGDTCTVALAVSGGTKTVDVRGSTDTITGFSGALIC